MSPRLSRALTDTAITIAGVIGVMIYTIASVVIVASILSFGGIVSIIAALIVGAILLIVFTFTVTYMLD